MVSIIGDTNATGELLAVVQEKSRFESDFASGVGNAVRHYTLTDSTNARARQWADRGAPHGAVVVADAQTAGRGRLGRSWASSSGQNLLLSVILRTVMRDHVARGILPLATSLAVADTARTFTHSESISIKWPNDVLIEGRKCAGILVESPSEDIFLVGIGLNVNESDFPAELEGRATSFMLETGKRADRGEVFSVLIRNLNDWLGRVYEGDSKGVLSDYSNRVEGLGEQIKLVSGDTVVRGTFLGISDDGGLIVDSDVGPNVYYAGDVTIIKK